MPTAKQIRVTDISMPAPEFANDKARIAWEIGQAVSSITKSIPAESPSLDARTIAFAPEDLTKGTYAIFLAGTVIGTNKPDVFVVPQRSLQILKRLRIRYQLI